MEKEVALHYKELVALYVVYMAASEAIIELEKKYPDIVHFLPFQMLKFSVDKERRILNSKEKPHGH